MADCTDPSDCSETLRELQTYLDGELSAEANRVISAHLDGCHDCLETFDFHAELKAVIARKCHSDRLPPGLLARIEQCLGQDFDGGVATGG